MSRRPHRHGVPPRTRLVRARRAGVLLLGLVAAPLPAQTEAHSRAIPVDPAVRLSASAAQDTGALATSTPLTLTLNLKLTAGQRDELSQLLAEQTDPGSSDYRHWLTAGQFAARFGASSQTIDHVRSWLESSGLTLDSVSPSRRRMTVSGPAGAVERALGVSLRTFRSETGDSFAPAAQIRLPAAMVSLVQSVSGLSSAADQEPAKIRVLTSSATFRAQPQGQSSAAQQQEPAAASSVTAFAALVEGNANPVLTLSSSACNGDLDPADVDTFRALLEQAAAQGITVLVQSGCDASLASAAFPASLSNALAFAEDSSSPMQKSLVASGIDARPRWQVAAGLPGDSFRREPDLTTSSGEALSATVHRLVAESGTRLGVINSTLYALAKVPGLYTQPDEVPAGTWEPATGLGVVDLQRLVKAFPRGVNSTTTYLSASSCPPCSYTYGDTITLTAKLVPSSYGNAAPSGTIVFSDAGTVLGSAGIDSSGQATITTGALPAGAHNIIATYSGDANYSGSASSPPIGAYIKIANATLSATLSPSTNLPYGATATATVTVTLPEVGAAPAGSVTAVINGVTNSQANAILSPNPGGNSATANILISAPKPGSYEVDVSCQGDQNYQCQTPARLSLKTVKGYTNTTVSVQPAAPQAGEPVSLTAAVVNSGNGTDSYTYGGSISFYDSGKLIATAPVATNQATTTTTLSGNRTHNITAVYTGDSFWNSSTSGAVAVSPTILPDALTLGTNLSGDTTLAGVNIRFTGTVTTTITFQSGPTGTITFFDTFNGAVVQLGNPAVLVSNGAAASIGLLSTTGLQPGIHRIYVQYSGDDNYAPATSAVVQLSLSDFSLSFTPSNLTIDQGKSAQISVLVNNSGGFNGTVSLGCTPPSGSAATCNFAPSSVTGAGTTTLTINTASALSARGATQGGARSERLTLAGGAAMATLLWLVLPRRRLPSLLALLLMSTLGGVLGCGTGLISGGSGSSGGSAGNGGATTADPGTPLGTQNFTITASGSDGTNVVRHTLQYQVTVQ